MKIRFVWFLTLFSSLSACYPIKEPAQYNALASNPSFLHACSKQLTAVIIHDIFKPPVASRIYAYANLAAYEALRPANPKYAALLGKLNGSAATPTPQPGLVYCYPIASLKAFLTVGRTLTFSTDLWDTFEKELLPKLVQLGIPDEVYERSTAYGELVAKQVLTYADNDNYKQTRGFRYTVTNKPGTWVPTPPAYADACEPQWNTVRSFTLDSLAQFRCPPPVSFDLGKSSAFWKLTEEVHNTVNKQTEEQRAIAYFWDDNAFVTNVSGHVMYASKKMTPPGHWQAIVTTLATQQKFSMMASLEAYTLSSIALFDAFIVCWDEKYRSVRIRPETVINAYIDPQWRPFLETPSFPEYVSGHSAISASAGQILIHLFGNNLAFTDSTEYAYGHGIRHFPSVEAAYNETSVSRIYGGIHFRDGAMEGTRLGENVGKWVWNSLHSAPTVVAISNH